VVEESGHRLEGIAAVFLCASLLMGSLAFVPVGAKAFPDTATFQGYVTDGVSPVENAYVKGMLMMGNGQEINMTHTDSSGFYSMGVPGGLQYVVFVAEKSYEMNMVYAPISPGETKWLNFTMTPITEPTDVMLMGYVQDELGSPRSDGIVFGAVAAPGGNGAPYYANITAPNATGYYEVNITAAPYGGGAIAMDFSGYPMAENMTGSPLVSGMSYWFNLTLQPKVFNDTGTLSGVVTDIDTGTPLENVIVTVEVDQGMYDRYSNFTISDSSGMYTMGIRDGNSYITIQKIGYSMKRLEGVVLLPGPNVIDAELKATEAKIRGNVTDLGSMMGLQNAYVILSDQNGNMSIAYTNESGYYELDAFAGTDLVVAARADGYSQDYVMVNVSAGDEMWFDFGLWPATAWLVGTVTDGGTGDPLPWANIQLIGPRYSTWAPNLDSGGHYNVSLVPDNYTIQAFAPDYWPFTADNVYVADGVETVYDIVMTPFKNANLTGNVTDQITGAPIPGAQVSINYWYFYDSTMTDSEGNYSMSVPGGDLNIWANAPSYQSYSGTVHVDNFTDAVFNIVLMPYMPPTTVLLKGNVTDSGSGDPVSGANVRVHFADRSYQNQTMTNDSGYYEMYVPPWAIEVTAWGPGHGPTFASTNVSGMSELVLDLQLPPDGMQPQLITFTQVPDQNISVLNPTVIDFVVEELYLREMNLYMLMEWNSSGTNHNYTVTQGWRTSYDPLDPRNDLNPSVMGMRYTVHFVWDASGSGAIVSNSTDSFYLPCSQYWDGSRYLNMVRGYYSNSSVTDISGTAVFDSDTHALEMFWTDSGFPIIMPDPSGVLKLAATFFEFSGGTIIRWFETRVVAEMPVADIACSFFGIAPSGNYKTLLMTNGWSDGRWDFTDSVVDNTPPIANAGPDQDVIENSTVTLDATGSFDNGWITSYSWSFVDAHGDTVNLTGDVVTCSFNATGTYSVRLDVGDAANWWTVDWVSISVGPDMPPTAVAGNDIFTDEDVSVSFDGTGSSDDLGIVNYTWAIVELSAEIYDATPTFTFATPGVYNVELVVTDTIGQSSVADALVVTVNDTTAPTAVASALTLVNIGSLAEMNASGSSDNVGIVNYTWSFTDGTYTELYGMVVSHAFTTLGTHVVTLVVADGAGLTDSDTVSVVVNGYPVAHAGADQLVNFGSTVTFNASATTDDMDAPTALNFTWTFTYSGVLRNIWGLEVGFLFSDPSSYIITLTVTDSNGLSSTDSLLLTVNGPPTANAGPDETVAAGDTVEFDGSMSSDVGGTGTLNYTWNFTVSGSLVTLYGVHPTHVFSVVGAYNVTLTVRDSGSLTSSDTMTVTVAPANAAPVADAGDDQTVKAGDLVVFDGGGSTDDAATTGLNYTWEFVYDGQTQKRYGPQPTFEFLVAGTYTVTLTVRDAGGLTSTDTVVITVEEKEAKSFVSQYWWSLVLIVVAAVALVALLLMKRKGTGGSKAHEASETEEEKEPPPPDEEEL
jgi:PKD repeat protein